MRYIDLNNDPRKSHFDYFRTLPYPYLGITVNVDVTEFVNVCKEKKISFYLAFMHVAALAADRVPEIRRRIRGDGIVEYESCPTSHVELLDDGSYCYCTLRHDMPWNEYYPYAVKHREDNRINGTIAEDSDVDSYYFISTLPWLDYTGLIQPVSCGDESNPRITWGKYVSDAEGRRHMPLTILLHHALADGLHLAAFYKNVEHETSALAEIIKERLQFSLAQYFVVH